MEPIIMSIDQMILSFLEPSSNIMMIGKVVAAMGVVAIGVTSTYFLWKLQCKPKEAINALNYMEINVVTTEESCNSVVAVLRSKCKIHSALGFDCEWVIHPRFRNAVALVQLSSHDGYCGLFRLNLMQSVPLSLKNLLEDKNIYKVGVVPSANAKNLRLDYIVQVESTLDIRHLANHPGGLAELSKDLLNIVLDKDWRISCSNWEADILSERQMMYAAADAHVAIKLYNKLFNEFVASGYRKYLPWLWWNSNTEIRELVKFCDLCRTYVDVPFKFGEKEVKKQKFPKNKNENMTRKSPLYHNCYLQAPDGEVLCTCDNKKAQWYIDKGLAVKVCDDPMTARLKFEPSGRSVGDVGKYYQSVKENRCVVCGRYDSFIRKNVVPREYRKCFPEIMKEHSSHDVVLLCARCHKTSNMRDQELRSRLAVDCDASVSSYGDKQRYYEEVDARKIRSAAHALLYQSQKNNTLPYDRQRELVVQLLQNYPSQTEVTSALLQEAAIVENEYESHGAKVVDHYLQNAGLLKLEELWRQHFLDSMQPQHMPPLWSVRHNEERLIVKLKEGRLTKEDPILAGLGLSLT